jgi:hypothetical protein
VLAGGERERRVGLALDAGHGERGPPVADRDLARLAELAAERAHRGHGDGDDRRGPRVLGHPAREPEHPHAQPVAPGGVAADHVVALERVQDAIDRRARDPAAPHELTDPEPGALALELVQERHHPLDHRHGMQGPHGVLSTIERAAP